MPNQFSKTKEYYRGVLRVFLDEDLSVPKDKLAKAMLAQLRKHIGAIDLADEDGLTEAAAITSVVGAVLEEIYAGNDEV